MPKRWARRRARLWQIRPHGRAAVDVITDLRASWTDVSFWASWELGPRGSSPRAGAPLRADHEHEHDGHIKVIGDCAKICNEASHHCLDQLRKGGPHAEHHAKAHEAAMDCQAFCVLTATLTARSSPMASYAHKACADACRDCAAACEGHTDEIMKECIKACRECEKVCRRWARPAGADRLTTA